MNRTLRKPSTLSESLQRHLNAYALAASAARVGMLRIVSSTECILPAGIALAGLLAAPEVAQAKIVYTPAHKTLPDCLFHTSSCLKLDLNHDKVVDFILPFWETPNVSQSAVSARDARKQPKNEIWGTISTGHLRFGTHTQTYKSAVASALNSGVLIGAKSAKFAADHNIMRHSNQVSSGSIGPWNNVTNKYLGLKFYIKGKPHYGWARLNVNHKSGFQQAILTGYAYETTPNKPIIAGKTKGRDVITVQSDSLGRLARGSAVQ
jgi:hypothetical protein